MVNFDSDALTSGRVDQFSGSLDCFWAAVLRLPRTRRAPGAVHRRALRSQGNRNAPPGAAGRAGHECHFAVQIRVPTTTASLEGDGRCHLVPTERGPWGASRGAIDYRTRSPAPDAAGVRAPQGCENPATHQRSRVSVTGVGCLRTDRVACPSFVSRPVAPASESNDNPLSLGYRIVSAPAVVRPPREGHVIVPRTAHSDLPGT